jgi:hypothetical protein
MRLNKHAEIIIINLISKIFFIDKNFSSAQSVILILLFEHSVQ